MRIQKILNNNVVQTSNKNKDELIVMGRGIAFQGKVGDPINVYYGVLVPRWTTMNFPLVLSQVENNPDTMVDFQALTDQANSNALSVDTIRDIILQVQSGANVATETTMTLNDVLNELLPGLIPLILTFACIWLLRKKVSPIAIIGGIFVLGIALYSVGIMG